MSHTTCAIEDCGRPAKRRGYCWRHYRADLAASRARLAGATCGIEGCGRIARRRGYCWTHYERAQGKSRVPLTASIRPWGRMPWQVLTDAIDRYTEQSEYASPEEFERALTALRMARLRSVRR